MLHLDRLINVNIFLLIIFGLRVRWNDEPLDMPVKGAAFHLTLLVSVFDQLIVAQHAASSLSTWFAVGTLG